MFDPLFISYLLLSATFIIVHFSMIFRVSVEKARGTPRGSDVWRGSGRHPRDYGPPPPRRRSHGRDR